MSNLTEMEISRGYKDNGCQSKSMLGRDYRGSLNTTKDGIPCQRWSDTEPHEHPFTDVGEHNFCRNPVEAPASQVFCYTTDPSQRYQFCSVPFCSPLKVFDFSLDDDMKLDVENEYTQASLKVDIPSSFTICTSFMVESWSEYNVADVFNLDSNDDLIDRNVWLTASMFAGPAFTKFTIRSSEGRLIGKSRIFYPHQWTTICFSFDKDSYLARLVVDGYELIEKVMRVPQRPRNLTLILGLNGDSVEMTGRTTNLNIFPSALSVTRMKKLTEAGSRECGAPGGFLSWEEAEWTLHSKARVIEVEGTLEGPCRRQSKVQVYPMLGYQGQSTCMELCQKFGGQSPSVKTLNSWEYLHKEFQYLSPGPRNLPEYIWLSATEVRQENWPKSIQAEEGKWRDYYTGHELANFSKPWLSSNGDAEEGEHSNCIFFQPQSFLKRSWREWQCQAENLGCPCSFKTPPLLRLRGSCPG